MSYDELLRDMERALVAIDASKPYRYQPTTSLPALSPQMQAALDAEAEMVASVVKRARSIASELDAIRADLREAVKLIRLTCSGYESPEWKEQAAELLDRHKETP